MALLAGVSQSDAVSFSACCIRRHLTLVWPGAGDVTLGDIVRVAFLAGSFHLMVLRNRILAAGACAIPVFFLPLAHQVSALLVALLSPLLLLLSCHLEAFSLWFSGCGLKGHPRGPPQVQPDCGFPTCPGVQMAGSMVLFLT